MKRNLLVLFTCAAVSYCAFSQENSINRNGFGIKGGVNATTVHTQDDTPVAFETDAEYKVGYHVGIFAEVFVNDFKKIAVQPELLYSLDGYKIKDYQSGNNNGELVYDLHTVNLPILLKYYFTPNFNIHLGPQATYQVCQSYKIDDNEISNTAFKRRINSTNISVVAGLEVLLSEYIAFGVRYNHGGKTLYKTRDAVDVTHRSFQLGVGIKF